MDNKKKTDSIMRYVVYLLCGVLLTQQHPERAGSRADQRAQNVKNQASP